MATFETKFGVGDDVFFVDVECRAPVGPVRVTGVEIFAVEDGPLHVLYNFNNVRRRESYVFSDHTTALKMSRDREWLLAQIRQ